MAPYDRLGFHDSTIVSFTLSERRLEMILSDVLSTNGKVNVSLSIASVSRALIDHKVTDELKISGALGDVLSLEVVEDKISLLVEWTDFNPRKSATILYEIFGTDIQIKVLE